MPLDEYRAKRDFSATPEPAGGNPSGEQRIFVVQQHHARAMHYDFRLELDGVLLSWAIPKGPSYDPKDKRLAVHVEDHPLDYASFEGTIPKGEYGGGNVIVWDRGTWEPITDPHEGLAKGDFKIRLAGEKLVGGWVLVRLKPRAGEKRENWLLIKERDEHARPSAEFNVTADKPLSVVSGVKVDDIGGVEAAAGEQPEQQGDDHAGGQLLDAAMSSSRATAQPVEAEMVTPPELALCTLVAEPPQSSGWLGEVKYDGYRVTVAVENGSARCWSRHGEDYSGKIAPVIAAAAALPAASALLDGEIVVFDERGISQFGLLQQALGSEPDRIVLVAFDLLYLNGYDLRPLGTRERKELLRTLLAGEASDAPVRFTEHIEDGVTAFMEVACAQGLEGVIAKRADAPYPHGRTPAWLKMKCRSSQELVVVGFTEPKGAREGFGALLLGYYEDGKLIYAGRAGSGFSENTLRELYGRLTKLERRTPPVTDPERASNGVLHWVTPKLIAQVEFAEWTSDGVLRQASFLGLRDDIDPRSVRREEPARPETLRDTERPEPPSAGSNSGSDVVAGVKISNPGKQLFPGGGLTKVELARYYEAIARLMLPEVAERVLTLVRCPVGDGRGGCFYQRHPDRGFSRHVQTLHHVLRKHDEPDEWLFVTDVAGLVALAQMGVAEIHTWLSRTDEPRRPDRIVFDLDPGPDVTWEQIVHAAGLVRDECDSLGFTPHVKSTGSKGLHVVLPIEPVWEFERIRAFARSIAERIAERHPDDLTSKMAKTQRPGRIFLDYVRNSETASAIAPYSTRYLEGPSVALPLSWDELDPTEDIRRRFTPDLVLERMAAGIDPWRDIDASSARGRVLKDAEGTLPV